MIIQKKTHFLIVLTITLIYWLVAINQGRPTRGPRAKSGPPKVLKWPAVGWLIDASALTLWVAEKYHKITLFLAENTDQIWAKTFLFYGSSPTFWQKKLIKSERRLFFCFFVFVCFGLHLLFGRKYWSNLSEDLFFLVFTYFLAEKTINFWLAKSFGTANLACGWKRLDAPAINYLR